MANNKVEFKAWMHETKTLSDPTKTYSPSSIVSCLFFLSSALKKLELSTDRMTIFDYDSYDDFLNINNKIRNHPDFGILDGRGKAQRWIHNGLLLYERFLREKEEISNDARNDCFISIVTEGGKVKYYTTFYERNINCRKQAISYHGLNCQCCGMNFESVYGELGRDFIEVHHIKPLSTLSEPVEINPETDLVCLCSNCHRMIHRHKDRVLTVAELQSEIERQGISA